MGEGGGGYGKGGRITNENYYDNFIFDLLKLKFNQKATQTQSKKEYIPVFSYQKKFYINYLTLRFHCFIVKNNLSFADIDVVNKNSLR